LGASKVQLTAVPCCFWPSKFHLKRGQCNFSDAPFNFRPGIDQLLAVPCHWAPNNNYLKANKNQLEATKRQ
jgi:hypothetical protein